MNKQTEITLYNKAIQTIFFFLTLFTAVLFTKSVVASDGGISLSDTRVIFDNTSKSQKITVNNQSDRVYLINSKLLRTPEGEPVNTDSAPFIVTPPLFRLESDSNNTVLVVPNDLSSLPSDRESVFYLSFLAIPAVSKLPDNNAGDELLQPRLSIGIRSVIKLFYRPSALVMTASDAPEKLHFSMKNGMLHVDNPTPYYLTLARLQTDSSVTDVREQGAMIAPYSSRDYRISGNVRKVSWAVINDHGTVSSTYHSVL